MVKKDQYNVAVAGATGAVGRKMLEILEERKFPVATLKALASAKSVGQTLTFNGGPVTVEELNENSFEGVDISLFSAGASVSRQFAPSAVKSGCIVID
ncbi:MAG: aspartate-semialdehyde dehydrogenase, partial [Nitrospinaceae bacterium]|nr:aspartate-semialdehyde dehydrogenase [Nitrospinaceae bacterium]